MPNSENGKKNKNKSKYSPPEDGHVDYEVQAYFYDGAYIKEHTRGAFSNDIISQASGNYPMHELLDFYAPIGSQYARTELNYKPPWISEELLEYSLKGLDSIKL